MERITFTIDDQLYENFRKAVEEKLGHGKRVFNKAVEEAIVRWINRKEAKNS